MVRRKRLAPRVVMSEEQFGRLLAAIQATPHVCLPCPLPHYYPLTHPYWDSPFVYYGTGTAPVSPTYTVTNISTWGPNASREVT